MTDNVLDQARDSLDGGRAWCKNEGRDGQGRMCIAGAIDALALDRVPYLAARVALEGVIAEQYPCRSVHSVFGTVMISVFNDHPATTWADIDMVLDKAARLLDEQVPA